MKRARTIALPRPKGTRASSRVAVVLTMHPRELRELEDRAARASMSLTAYVKALLDSDGDDVQPRVRNPRINWLEDNTGATLAKRCWKNVAGLALRCARPEGHDGPCDTGYLRPAREPS